MFMKSEARQWQKTVPQPIKFDRPEVFQPRDIIHLDFETRSPVPFGRQSGAVSGWQYARNPMTQIICMAYAINEEEVQMWRALEGEPFPKILIEAVFDGVTLGAHNADFEWNIWNGILVRDHRAPIVGMDQMDCTAARAAILALPRSLEEAAKALGLDVEKDAVGHRLMMRMSRPRSLTKKEIEAGVTGIRWAEKPDQLSRLYQYCEQDVVVERRLHEVMPPMTLDDRKDWLATHRMNMRGVAVDTDFIRAAEITLKDSMDQVDRSITQLTEGAVSGVTQLDTMRSWVSSQIGRPVPSLDKPSVEKFLAGKIPTIVRKVLQLRYEAGKSSVAKYRRIKSLTSEDGIMRENVLFRGAATGRLAGRGAQLQNLPSRGVLDKEVADQIIAAMRAMQANEVEAMKDWITLCFTDVPHAMSSCLRGSIVTRDEDKDLFVADFSNIEGRVVAWFGGEQWKLDAFRLYDSGKGPDLYKVTASGIMGCKPEEVDSIMRNVLGKITDLACGFGGGAGAYASFADVYKVDMSTHWPTIQKAVPVKLLEDAARNYERFGRASTKMSQDSWLASETAKLAWRSKHPGVVKCWYEAEEVAIHAMHNPGIWYGFAGGKCAIQSVEINGVTFLAYRLPSGRVIYKANAKLELTEKFGQMKPTISFWGVDSVTRSWKKMTTYGGDIFQSFVQGTAADLMYAGWHNLEEDGFDVVLSVHDELVSEGPSDRSLSEYIDQITDMPDWSEGCPVSAAGFVSNRYGAK